MIILRLAPFNICKALISYIPQLLPKNAKPKKLMRHRHFCNIAALADILNYRCNYVPVYKIYTTLLTPCTEIQHILSLSTQLDILDFRVRLSEYIVEFVATLVSLL